MAYVAIQGGQRAIEEAARLSEYLRTEQGVEGRPVSLDDIKYQLRGLHSRVLSEGGLYHPDLAALAVKQSMGDPLEASFALRAYRSTRPRRMETAAHDTSLMDESPEAFQKISGTWLENLNADDVPDTFPKVIDLLREEGLLAPSDGDCSEEAFDITRQPMIFPVPRAAALQSMARGETGSLLMIAYSNMRGYGDVHPTVGEVCVGYLPVELPHPVTGTPVEIGEVLMTKCEVVAMYEGGDDAQTQPRFTVGYGACFGHNEVKAIAMAILDRALQKGMREGAANPSEDPEFVLLHIDGIDSMGFCTHYKMPHYVTFQSDMDRLRTTQSKKECDL
jgi:alpha-D-ribose 1-methylphosphonate 5-triphosphate synthase subunit PhnI